MGLGAGATRATPLLMPAGATIEMLLEEASPVGSSPRVRGPRRARTPAPTPTAAHPRACGDHKAWISKHPDLPGSSPRVRGPHLGAVAAVGAVRLIPARAGTTRGTSDGARAVAAHPRACGDHTRYQRWSAGGGGSSPRVRGPHRRRPPQRHLGRLIPARAGTTASTRSTPSAAMAHPRACGDHGQRASRRMQQSGSSPRVRGPPPPWWP